MINNDIITDFSKVYKKDQNMVSSAWELAKQQAKDKYSDSDEEYFPYVVSLTKQNLNVEQEENPIVADDEKQSLFTTPPETSNMKPKSSTFMKQEAITDLEYMDWKLKSSNKIAIVRFLIQDKLYQMEFNYIKEGQSNWIYEWNMLAKQGIDSLVTVSIEQLNSDNSYQKIAVNKNNLSTENKPALTKVMLQAFLEYFKDYNKAKDIQYFIFTAESQVRYEFLKEFIKSLHTKYTNIKEVEEVSKSLSKPFKKVLACRNSNAKLKEDDAGGGDTGGTVTSGSFDSAPFDAGRKRKDWKKDWDSQKPEKTKKEKVRRFRLIDLSSIDK
jgi:hypothetical protein